MAALILALAAARAATPEEKAQQAELDRLRSMVAGEVQLAAFDLVDELVFGWVTDPPFGAPTPVVLAGVSVPVGYGTGLEAMLENHVANVLGHHPGANVVLSHCPACTAVVVHSGHDATVVTRGIDAPEVLAELGAGGDGRHALFLDLEAEGSWLVLRARLTRLTPELPIVWSHTLATSAATPALLRDATDLTSAAEAREDYLDALRDRGPLAIPVRVGMRFYGLPDGGGTPPPPFLWVQTGVELGATSAEAWTASLVAGYSFIPQAYQGILAETRVNRLLTGRARSHHRPDLYGFVGVAAMTVWGPATASFQRERQTADDILTAAAGEGPRTTFGTISFGLDARMGHRVGMAAFLESLPGLDSSPNIGDHWRPFGIPLQSFGTEVVLWF